MEDMPLFASVKVATLPYTLHNGDCLDVLKTLPDASVDAVVSDPPSGIFLWVKIGIAIRAVEPSGFAG
jgi:hypothetical protein